MKSILPGILALLLMQTLLPAKEAVFYLGSYTGPNKSEGILVGKLDTDTGKLTPVTTAIKVDNPSFLAISPDGKYIYAALEAKEGLVAAYRIETDGNLTPLNQMPSGGSGACHVWVDAGHLFVSNYNSGNVAVFPIKADGSLGERSAFEQFSGSGPDADRQKGPHAHGMITVGKHAYACDLGTDTIWTFTFDPASGSLKATDNPGKAPAGAGPRHLALSSDGKFLYVNNEMGMSVTAFRRDPETGTLTELQTLSTLPDEAGKPLALDQTPKNGNNKTSEIVAHPSGKWLYVSNRGHESMAVYAIGADGKLTWVENIATPLKTPRGFAIDPTGKWMLVAGQRSDSLVVFKIDPATGKLTDTGERGTAKVPISVSFVPGT